MWRTDIGLHGFILVYYGLFSVPVIGSVFFGFTRNIDISSAHIISFLQYRVVSAIPVIIPGPW